MIFEMTVQIRVSDFEKGLQWYQLLLDKEPDFIPHEGFAEWELVPGSWLQVGEGTPAESSGPIRLGVKDLETCRAKWKQLGIEGVEIHSREEVPVKWCTFADPWGNLIGFFEYLDKTEEKKRIKEIIDK
ncbi:VOC family protein [Ornithinibacillus sp. 179-J 7C1 HS]|uniref:VOC family protein n=1 Tax=Ornithinibacillus sp. 179-J 7C1 HS TaxID=3142384 RepID=UPI0039A1479E